MQAVQILNSHADEIIQVFWRHAITRSPGYFIYGRMHLAFYDVTHDLDQFIPKLEPKPVRLAERLTHRGVAVARTFVRPYEDIPQETDPIEFIHSQKSFNVCLLGYINERQWTKVLTDERDVRGESRDALVDILERL